MCSNEIEFDVAPELERNFFSGDLSDFFMMFPAGEPDPGKPEYFNDDRHTFDVAFIDLCGLMRNKNKLALTRFFQRRLLNAVTIVGVTLCFRDTTGLDYFHESTIGGFSEIQRIANECGYTQTKV